MVILNLKLNNILSFENFNVNFSYPTKLRNSIIDGEALKNISSFRYKKVNIFMGTNACGKTSLIRIIWNLLLFLNTKEKQYISKLVRKNTGPSYIEMDFATETDVESILHRVKIKIECSGIDEALNDNHEVLVAYNKVKLDGKASYENIVVRLNNREYKYENYLDGLNEIQLPLGFNVVLPATESNFDKIVFCRTSTKEDNDLYLDIINRVFKTLDSSIEKIYKSKDANNALVIEHDKVGKIIVQEAHKLSDIPFLSSGTKYGFNIANMLYSIKKHLNGIYLIDEQFSYINSDIEKAILSTMVQLLGDDEQIFITTHNAAILDMGLPFHSLYFMKKENYGDKQLCEISCASEVENRNNVSAKSILLNDVFATAPDVNMIMEIGD